MQRHSWLNVSRLFEERVIPTKEGGHGCGPVVHVLLCVFNKITLQP